MKRNVIAVLGVVALLSMLLGALPASASAPASISPMPPNPDKILASMIKRGEVAADASAEAKQAAVDNYLKQKLSNMPADGNPLAAKQLSAREDKLNQLASGDIRGRKLGSQGDVPPSVPQWKALKGTDKLLLILIQFSKTPYNWTTNDGTSRTEAGPMHNEIPVPNNDFDLYIKDFSTKHYEDMLFTPGGWTMPSDSPRYANKHLGSMHDYYLEQSFGQYTVDGTAYGWFTVDKPEAYYGDDAKAGGHDNLRPGTTKDLIADAVSVINAQNAINWSEYDTDNDCFIDHPLFIHAGIDQSGGGGAQGADAIWAHSSSVYQKVGTSSACPGGLYIYNYTIMPEDGGVGVFAHEFGHDLGLPDEYDTIYSGAGDGVGFWSLMSSGSWVGQPAQAQPSDMSIWGRYSLGWVVPGDNMAVIKSDGLSKSPVQFRLEQAERWGGTGTLNALRISLPPKPLVVNAPHSGSYEWFGGKADEIDTTLKRTVDLTGKTSASLSFWTWYDIEQDWDYGFVQASTDNGLTWKSLPIEGTSSTIDPSGMESIAANLPGFTGNSGGWVQKTYDLKDYAGKKVMLQFRYMTDWGTSMAGFYMDDIGVTANGAQVFFDDVEAEDAGWTADGWARDQGSSLKTQYYLMEYRNTRPMETKWGGATLVNFDNGLSNVYQYDIGPKGNPDQPAYFAYTPGLLLWYRDMTFTDNWTGVHPGGGYLLPVDAHPRAFVMPQGTGTAWRPRVLTYDTTFGFKRPADLNFLWGNAMIVYQGMQAVPSFDDSVPYWNNKAPAESVKTPDFGIVFRVTGEAKDGSAATVGVGVK